MKVQDTGTGIPASELAHIFERFHRVREHGDAASKVLVSASRWYKSWSTCTADSISVESEVSKGTSFTVTVPFGTEHLPQDKVRETAGHRSTIPEPTRS